GRPAVQQAHGERLLRGRQPLEVHLPRRVRPLRRPHGPATGHGGGPVPLVRRGRSAALRLAQPARHLRLPEGVGKPRPDTLHDRRGAVHRPVHPASALLRHQQRAGERAAAEHDGARVGAALLLLAPVYLTSSTTKPLTPPWVTFLPSTVMVFATPSSAVA